MLTFAVVVSRSGGRIAGPVLDRLRERDCADVPFDVRSHLVWSNENGTVWFAGWQDAADQSSPAHHWHADDDGLTAFAGHLWPRREGWTGTGPWARQLADYLRATPLDGGTDDLAGIYVAASLRAHGRGTIAADPLGIGLVYWGHGRDLIVISSRAALAARLLAAQHATHPKRDPIGAGWIAYAPRAMGLQTGFTDVSVVPQGALVDIDPAGGARVRNPSPPPWRIPLGDATSPEDTLEDARREMTAFTRVALALPGRAPRAGLTGGKDSRLILALLIADGSAADVEFQTYGEDDLPDVVVARQIAESLGLHHVVKPDRAELWAWQRRLDAAMRDEGYADVSSREVALRLSAWACSGARNVFAPHLGRPPSGDRTLLTGLFGETLRTNFPVSGGFRSKARIARFPSDMSFGTVGILRPEALAHYRAETRRLLFEGSLETDSPQDVVDVFYIRNWLRRWFGITQEVDSQGRMFPLYSTTAIRLAFAIGAENRHAERIHYQLIRQAYEPLVHTSFADGSWGAGAADPLTAPRRHRAPATARAITGAVAGWAKRFKRSTSWKRTANSDRRATVEAVDVDIMRRFLRYDPSNPVFEIIDPAATEQALDRFEQLPPREKMQLFGALTAALWLGGHEIALPRSLPSN
jgi:hypothetical protein